MRLRLALGMLFTGLLVLFGLAAPGALASPEDDYSGPYFGDGNLPPGCIRDMSRTNPDNDCFHMRSA